MCTRGGHRRLRPSKARCVLCFSFHARCPASFWKTVAIVVVVLLLLLEIHAGRRRKDVPYVSVRPTDRRCPRWTTDPVEWCGESVSCPSGRTTRSFVRTFFADVLLKLSLPLRMYANISDDSSRTRLCSYFLPPSTLHPTQTFSLPQNP